MIEANGAKGRVNRECGVLELKGLFCKYLTFDNCWHVDVVVGAPPSLNSLHVFGVRIRFLHLQ